MKFVDLTSKDGTRVFLNVDKIIAITTDSENDTVLKLTDGQLFVDQTPDEIMMRLRGCYEN